MPIVYGALVDIHLLGGKVQTLTISSGQINWNTANGDIGVVTLTSNATLNNPTNIVAGRTYLLIVRQDSTGNRTLNFGSAYKFPGGETPQFAIAANKVVIASFYSDGTNMYCIGLTWY